MCLVCLAVLFPGVQLTMLLLEHLQSSDGKLQVCLQLHLTIQKERKGKEVSQTHKGTGAKTQEPRKQSKHNKTNRAVALLSTKHGCCFLWSSSSRFLAARFVAVLCFEKGRRKKNESPSTTTSACCFCSCLCRCFFAFVCAQALMSHSPAAHTGKYLTAATHKIRPLRR